MIERIVLYVYASRAQFVCTPRATGDPDEIHLGRVFRTIRGNNRYHREERYNRWMKVVIVTVISRAGNYEYMQ